MKPKITPALCVGHLVTSADHRRVARLKLLQEGWEYLDGGSFSSVWKSPCGTRVVKITKPDSGSEATVKAALALPANRHLPLIYATLQLACGGWATEVEVLRPCPNEPYFQWREGFFAFRDDKLDGLDPAMAQALTALQLTADAMGMSATDRWDAHSGNIMLRDNEDGSSTVVLTDLLYDVERVRGGHGWGGSRHSATGVCQSLAEEQAGVQIEYDPDSPVPQHLRERIPAVPLAPVANVAVPL